MAYSDFSTWPSLVEMDPEYRKFLETGPPGPSPPKDPSQIPAMRPMMKKMQLNAPYQQIDRTGVTEETTSIPARDGYQIPAVLYKPNSSSGLGPLAVLFHGGGFMLGFPEMEAPAAVALVQNHGASVISVDYRLAPEHTFPKAIEDGWDALKWAASNALSLNANPSKGFLLGGDSAGGNIAAVLSHLARDKQLSPPLTGVYLNYPITVGPDVIPEHLKKDYQAFEQNANAAGILNRASIMGILAIYKPDQKSQSYSPLLSDHSGLPKTWLHACGLDPLRDDTLLYERELKKAGVETQLVVSPGVPHAFETTNAELKAAERFGEERKKAFAWILS